MANVKKLNIPILLLSFVLSVFLWMHVKNDTISEMESSGTFAFTMELKPRNTPPGYVVVGTIPKTVTFTAIGKIEEQRKINGDNLSAYVDLSDRPADGRFAVQLENASNYQVTWQPANYRIPIRLEKEISRRVNIEIEASGEFKIENFRYDGATCDPSTVTVTGAQSLVDQVKKARAYLNLSSLESDSSQRAKVDVLDADGVPIANLSLSTETVTVRAIIAPRPPKRSLLIQPVWSGTPEFGSTIGSYEFSPAQVMVEGPADILANMAIIETKPINIAGLTQSTTMPVELALPEGIHLTRADVVSIKITLKKSGPVGNTNGGP